MLLRNGIYNLIGGVLRVICLGITSPFLLNTMGLERYGTWSLVSSVIAILTFAEAGLSSATTVFISQDINEEDNSSLSSTITIVFSTIIVLSFIASGSLYWGSDTIISFFPSLGVQEKDVALKALKIASLVIFGQLVQQLFVGLEQAFNDYKLINTVTTLQWILFCSGWCVLGFLKYDSVALISWQLTVTILVLIIHLNSTKKLLQEVTIIFSWNSKRASEIVKYCSSTWIATLGGLLFTKGDRLVIGSLLGTSSLAIYSAFSDFSGTINYFSAKPIQPLLPFISSYVPSSCSKKNLHDKLRVSLLVSSYISVSMGILLLNSSKYLVSIVMPGDSGYQYHLGFQFLILITTVYSLNSVGYFVMLGLKKVKEFAAINIISGILSLTLIYFGAITFGFTGAIIGNIGFFASLSFLFVSFNYLKVPLSIIFRSLLFPVLFMIFSFSLYHLIPSQELLPLASFMELLLFSGYFAWMYKYAK